MPHGDWRTTEEIEVKTLLEHSRPSNDEQVFSAKMKHLVRYAHLAILMGKLWDIIQQPTVSSQQDIQGRPSESVSSASLAVACSISSAATLSLICTGDTLRIDCPLSASLVTLKGVLKGFLRFEAELKAGVT